MVAFADEKHGDRELQLYLGLRSRKEVKGARERRKHESGSLL